MPDLTPRSQYGNAWESTRVAAKEGWILDPQNRVVILHGINLSGGTKMPFCQASADGDVGVAATAAALASAGGSASSSSEFFGALPRAPSTSLSASVAASSSSNPQTKQEEARAKNKGAIPGVIYSYMEEHFYDHRNVSFVNRPFTLAEAELHFERLARWGCQCLRVLVPWEALEHSGPGIYDEDYITYLIKLLKIAGKYGLKCFLDPHVDCWSRFSGGSGMPGWTLELAGLDMRKFDATGAAVVQNTYENKENYPRMIWATNSIKVAAATMYTLFFAGQIFAPHAMVPLSTTVLSHLRKIHSTVVSDEAYRRGVSGGIKAPSPVQNLTPIPRVDQEFVERGRVNIQHFLQGHFIEAFSHLAQQIRDDDTKTVRDGLGAGLIDSGTVMGFDTLNEPSPGYLNHPNLNELLELADLQIGACPTPFQGLELAQGRTVNCQVWETGSLGPLRKGSLKVNEGKVNLWKRPFWRANRQYKSNNAFGEQHLYPPSAPAYPSPAYHPENSPFDVVSHLNITGDPAGESTAPSTRAPPPLVISPQSAESLASFSPKSLTPLELAESNLAKTGWPKPAGYSEVCLWAEHKVWDPQTGKLLKPNYFQRIPTRQYVPPGFQPGKEVEWKQDFWLPFVNTFSLRLRQQDPRFTIFVEPPINEEPPMFRLQKVLIGGATDQLKNMFRAIVSGQPHKAFKNQHTASIMRQSVPAIPPASASASGDGGDGEEKGKGPAETADYLYENACQHPVFDPVGDVGDNVVVAPHFYDGYTNVTRDFVPFTLDYLGYKRGIYWSVLGALKFGWGGVGQAWKDQVHGIQSDIQFAMGRDHGILMGETGLPIDMHNKTSFKNRYGYPKQSFAMKMLLDAMDASMLSFTLWNYCADNSNQWGDRWNGEDFSVWCPLDNGFLQPDFIEDSSGPGLGSDSRVQSTAQSKDNDLSDMTLTEISSELSNGMEEEAGCREGCIWWLCLPKTNVWTKRTAPKRLIIVSAEPSPDCLTGSTNTSDISLVPAKRAKKRVETLRTWQDLLPLSLQIERSRLEFYGGLRVGEPFVRAYPIAIWGEPVQYCFEPGRPLQDSEFLSRDISKKKTNDVKSWENRFVLFLTLSCDRRPKRDHSYHGGCHGEGISHANGQSNKEGTPDVTPSTDVFLPRFHFALDSPVGVDQFESLGAIQEIHEEIQRRAGCARSATDAIAKSSRDKGRWHRLDVKVTDGYFTIEPNRQLLQYWTSPQPTFDLHDNLAPTDEFFEGVEKRIRMLFSLGWDGKEGISTSVEQDWIKKLWRGMQKGDAAADYSTTPSSFACLWPFSSGAVDVVEAEERRKLKLTELRQKWREHLGIPGKGSTFCRRCGQMDVMHLHGVSARLQMWPGYRG
ncbi:hypothetical protein BC939DRAFT_531536 [Gamsiella multidivaricata]|uniref:uncharacterized protein n=1 Tax=Gamsiella multidivaricata TaxID=101098 RepID=UPI00221F7E80|nr:uncharacterized protein BC939DRAFT_531536 [Gamsiella multidivaricata]KAG0368227.1 hypothetical protein BGZ54_002405 [Gamsiella multidivaricata]KAI7819062.1 hypothetical protein BC939DRAFT_531536 [Gamsiella multidivaricata]